MRNKYRDARIDCKNQIEKLNASLEEEKLTLSFINKEQLDFFHRQQEKQQQLIERNANMPTSELDWMETVHKKDIKEQEQSFASLVDKQRVIEERIESIRDKIKKVEEFRDGLDKYYQNVVTSFGNVSFDFFSSYSIVISSNEELSQLPTENEIANDKKSEILDELNISPTHNNNLYFKKLGLTIDDPITGDKKIEVIGSFTDLDKALTNHNREDTTTPIRNLSNSSSISSSPLQSDNGMTFQMDMENTTTTSTTTTSKPIPVPNSEKLNTNNIYNSSIYSTSQSSLASTKSNRNTFAALNNKFISFNLQSDRLKRKTQLLEENRTLGSELKKVQAKNFTLSEEMGKIKQENQELKTENESLKQQIEELTKKLHALE